MVESSHDADDDTMAHTVFTVDKPKKKAEFPFWVPPHYRAMSKSSEKFSKGQIDKIKSDHQTASETSQVRNRDFLLAMGILICVDMVLWYGIKKIFYKNPQTGQYAGIWQTARSREPPRQSTRTSKKFHIPSPSASFRQNVSSQSFSVPPVVAHHMKVLQLGHITDRLPKRTEIKDAYHKVCLQSHPDTLERDMPESEKKRYEQRFIDATRSYQVLITLTSPMSDR
jgi:hypothetical protein